MKNVTTGLFISGFLIFAGIVRAQYAMEMYIPIGQSIGVSNVTSVIGPIESFDQETRQLVVASSRGRFQFQIGPHSDLWIDNSAREATNTYGNEADLKVGRECEVHYDGNSASNPGSIVWIKLRG
jgi:hypothetical protein